MTEQQVPDRLTPVDSTSMYLALRAAWIALLGTQPARASLLVLLAHWHWETGGGAGMHCFNVGNFKHVPGDGHEFCVFRAGETIQGKDVEFEQPFRAYESLGEGVSDYLGAIRGQFGFAWPAVDAGDPADFAHRLKLRSYYTAPESLYTTGLVARYQMLDATIPPDTLPDAGVAALAHAASQQAQAELPVLPDGPEEPGEPEDS